MPQYWDISATEITIAGLRAGDTVDAVFACSRKDRLTARTGTPYLALEFRDKTGTIGARIFKDADVLAGRFDRGDLVHVAGRVERFRDELAARSAGDFARRDRRSGDVPARSPTATSTSSTASSSTSRARSTTRRTEGCWRGMLGDAALRAEWRRAPCTRAGHHAYLGGLLEHTVAVGTLALECSQLHPRLNSDLLLCAALVHDIGKTREFVYGAEIGLSEEGRLLGHVVLGQQLLDRYSLPDDRRLALVHCVLDPPRAGAGAGTAVRVGRGAGAVPAECAGRLREGRVGARTAVITASGSPRGRQGDRFAAGFARS